MKTKLLSLLCLCSFSLLSFSQPYQPMLNDSSWIVGYYTFLGEYSFTIEPVGETTIGNYTYTRYWDGLTEYLLREDVTAKQVYRYENGNDQLLFDFGLSVGATTYAGGQLHTVVGIDTVNVNGGTRKVLYVNGMWFTDIWIEGVGGGIHPVRLYNEMPADPVYFLKCSAQQGINVYNKGIADGGTPTDCSAILAVDAPMAQASEIVFAPNPFSSEVSFKSSRPLSNAKIILVNPIGQTVKEISGINGYGITLNRDNLNSGIYLAQLFEDEKLIDTTRLIITD